MADEKHEESHGDSKQKAPNKGNMKLLIIIGIVVVALIGGFIIYTQLKTKGKSEETAQENKNTKTALVALDPFVVNLAEQGRFLKATMQLELSDASNQHLAANKIPHLRDAIITLVSSKSAESLSSPEGKILLKDELLLRSNQAVGKDIFRNLYFTEFVMQ